MPISKEDLFSVISECTKPVLKVLQSIESVISITDKGNDSKVPQVKEDESSNVREVVTELCGHWRDGDEEYDNRWLQDKMIKVITDRNNKFNIIPNADPYMKNIRDLITRYDNTGMDTVKFVNLLEAEVNRYFE